MDLPDHILELIKLLFYQFQNLIKEIVILESIKTLFVLIQWILKESTLVKVLTHLIGNMPVFDLLPQL